MNNNYISPIDELNSLTLQQLERFFDTPTDIDKGEYLGHEEEWFGEIAFKIAGSGHSGVEFLISRAAIVEEARLRSILAALSWPKEKSERISQILRFSLADSRSMIVAEAIDTAGHLGYTEFLDEVLSQKNHVSPYVVGSVLRYLTQLYPELAKPLLFSALEAQEPIVVQNGVDGLEELGSLDALPSIRQLQNHADANVRQASNGAVINLEKLLNKSNL